MKESSTLVFQKSTKQISNTQFSNTKISNTRSASTHAVPIRPFSHLHGNIWVVVVSFKGMHNICNVNKNNTVLKTSENNDSDHNEMSKDNTTRKFRNQTRFFFKRRFLLFFFSLTRHMQIGQGFDRFFQI